MGKYLAALWAHWVFLMTGTAALFIGLGLRIGRKISKVIKQWSDVPDWIFIVIGLVCIFFAGYGAWKDKNDALIALQERLRSPELVGEIDQIMGKESNGQSLIIVAGTIRNPTGPPSGIIGWKILIEFPSGKKVTGEIPMWTGKDYRIPISSLKGEFILRANNYWPRIGYNPIVGGGVLAGWFWSTFPGVDFKKAYNEHALIVVEVRDSVANKTHRFTHILEEGIHSGNLSPFLKH